MNMIEYVKNLFKRGGYIVSGDKLSKITDHSKVNLDPSELKRINRNLAEYSGDHEQVEFVNSNGTMNKRDFKHINMRKHSASLLAGLVFNEDCEINIAEDFVEANEFITNVFEHNDFKSNLNKYLEPTYALGGLSVRPYVDMNSGEVEFSWAIADAFYPLTSTTNGISEGVMVSTTVTQEKDKTIYYTLLEFHEWEGKLYKITNELYKSDDKDEVGRRVPLQEHYEGIEESMYLQGLSRPLFNYLTPYGFNNVNPHSPLGLGIADNSSSTLDQINETNDQFYWEVKMGQRTVFVSDKMLSAVPSEGGMPPKQVFDPDVNVYKGIRMNMEEEFVKDVTSDIRTDQYISAINQSLRTLELELGFSTGTFTYDGQSIKTATEIVSENNQTYRTRNNHAHEVEMFIKGLIVSVLELATATKVDGKSLYTGEIPTFKDIGVDFDDGVFQDRDALMKFYGEAVQNKFIPNREAMMRVFKVSEEQAMEWLEEINGPTKEEPKEIKIEVDEEPDPSEEEEESTESDQDDDELDKDKEDQ